MRLRTRRGALTLLPMFVSLFLLTAQPVMGFSSPKPVISGLSGLAGIASDSRGTLYYLLLPSATEADVYRLEPGSSTPTLIFPDSKPSDSSVGIGSLSFDREGNVYFLVTEYAQPDASGSSNTITTVYKLDASDDFAASEVYSTTSAYNFFTGHLTGTQLVISATNSRGDVAIGALSSSSTLNTFQAELLLTSASGGATNVEAMFGANSFIGALVIDDRGNMFAVAGAGVGNLVEVSPNGGTKTIGAGGFNLALDARGDLFMESRSVVGRQCLGVADSTTLTLTEYKEHTLDESSPTSIVLNQQTFSGYVVLGVSSDQFQTTSHGTILYVLYPSTRASCSGPLSWNVVVKSFRAGATSPTVVASETNPAGVTDTFSLAAFGQNFYYASENSGMVYLVKR